jgi:ADP-heptose:LPS heptosyltransferase
MTAGPVAVLGGQGLGDNLLEMVLLENARRAGLQVTMFCSRMCELHNWFPQHRIAPTLQPEAVDHALAGFQLILFPKAPWPGIERAIAENWINYGRLYRKNANRAKDMAYISGRIFKLTEPTPFSGIRPPAPLQHRRYEQRICIHPTSAELSKNWLPQRFLTLAERLQTKGFEPVFIMSAAEQEDWQPTINDRFPLHSFAGVDQCAAFLYESGFFIGNDSGGGHLASCLDIPVLSIHGRKGKSRVWRPGWGQVEVVTPLLNVIGGSLRQHLWKYFLSVSAVERGFERLTSRAQKTADD